MRIKVILILHQIADDLLNRPRLIVSNGCVDGILVIKFDVVRFSFFHLVLVEDWIFFAEEVRVLFVEQ